MVARGGGMGGKFWSKGINFQLQNAYVWRSNVQYGDRSEQYRTVGLKSA